MAEAAPDAGVFPDTLLGLVGRAFSMAILAGLSLALGGSLLVAVGYCLDHLRRLHVVQAGFLKLATDPPSPVPALARTPALRPPIFSL